MVTQHETPADHDVAHRGAILCIDKLLDSVVERHEVDVAQIEKCQVCLVVWRNPPDPVGHAEHAGAALGGEFEGFGGADPGLGRTVEHARQKGRQTHCFEHVLIVG